VQSFKRTCISQTKGAGTVKNNVTNDLPCTQALSFVCVIIDDLCTRKVRTCKGEPGYEAN